MPRSASDSDLLARSSFANVPLDGDAAPSAAAEWAATRRNALLAAATPVAPSPAAPTPAAAPPPPPASSSLRSSLYLGVRQLGALLRRSYLLKARGWRQTLAEFATPTLLMAALVVGSRLAEITVAEQEVFSDKPPLRSLVADARYGAVNSYFMNHTAGACATAQLFVAAAAPPGLVSALGWDVLGASAAAAGSAAATSAVLSAFGLTVADLGAFQGGLAGGGGGGVASAVAAAASALGLPAPGLEASLRAAAADPFNASGWSAVADAALAAALAPAPASNGTNATSLGVSAADVANYNGPLPIPSFDEYVAAHALINGAFRRYPPAWAAYRAIKEQLGVNVLGNLVELGGVAFVPDTPDVARLAAALGARHAAWAGRYRGAHADVATAREAAAGGDAVVGPWAVVVFDSATATQLTYTIRMRYTLVPATDELVSRFYRGLEPSYKAYYTSGFLSLQRAIDEAALDGALGGTNGTAASVGATRMLWGTPFPVFSFQRNSFYASAGPLLGLVMCLSMIYPLGMLIKGLVEEKESGARELMRVSGLFHCALGAAWALTYLLLFVAVAIAATIVLAGSVFPHCSPVVIWGLLFLFMLSCIPLGFLVSTAFNRARLASIFGPFALFALVLPRYIFFRTAQGQALGGKRAACLLAPTAFTFAADALGRYEAGNAGVTLGNLWEGGLSVGECCAWMFFDTVLYSLLALYFDYLLPNARRKAARPPWLPRISSLWRGGGARQQQRDAAAAADVEADAAAAADIEPLQPGEQPLVVMKHVSKVYDNGVPAVSNLDLQLLDSQITALLGHNGAGKSTAIGMLTGALPSSAGSISVCGLDVGRQRSEARGLLGVCPQQNVLFALLTVAEHLRLFAVLKGVRSCDVAPAVAELMHEVGLTDKAHAQACALSGGMKRRLQLACALVGGSRVILLDEPTSGQDPVSRRQTWELLRRVRAGRAVLLCTHYLDEADLLADRVAVMSEGRLRAAGSPLFLKRRLGGGYTLSVTAAQQRSASDDASNAAAPPSLTRLVAMHAPDATLVRAAGVEAAWQVPPGARRQLATLLAALEADADALGVGGFAISCATLEEVFLRLAGEAPATKDAAQFVSDLAHGGTGGDVEMAAITVASEEELPRHRRSADAVSVSCLPGLSKPRGAALLAERADSAAPAHAYEHDRQAPAASSSMDYDEEEQQHSPLPPQPQPPLLSVRDQDERSARRALREMLRKRALIARRDIKSVLSQVALPVLAIALTLLILKLDIDPVGPALRLSAAGLAASGGDSGAAELQLTPVWYPASAGAEWAAGFAAPPMRFVPISGSAAGNSSALSAALLQYRRPEAPFRYGAYVPDDPVLPRLSPALCVARASAADGAAAAAAALAVLAVRSNSTPGAALAAAAPLVGASALRAAQELAPPALNVLHNTSSSHALPIFVAELRAAQLRRLGGPALSVSTHPLPLTPEEVTTLAAFLRLLASFFVLVPFSYVPATYAAFVVRERAGGAKLQQLASGCGAVTYWLAAYVWEMANHTAVVLCCLILFAAFQLDVLIGTWDKGLGIFLLLMLYGTAATPLSFLYSFLFDSHASAQVAIAAAGFVTSFCLVLASFIMSITPSTVDLNARLVQLFRLFPGFCLGEGLIALATSSFDFSGVSGASGGAGGAQGNVTAYSAAAGAAPRNSFGDFTLTRGPNAFRWAVLGRPLLLLFAESWLYFAATLAVELRGARAAAALAAAAARPRHALAARLRRAAAAPQDADASAQPKAWQQQQQQNTEDPEVTAERARMQAPGSAADAVQIRGLRKVYAPRGAAAAKVALQDLWLGVRAGERFGLLGENGAGKTTTLSMLCCDVAPTAGDALVGGASILRAPAAVQRQIGYCPQRDPILELLSVREHLQLYARLKGLPERHVAAAAVATLRRVGLGPFAERLAGTLSGGNKRKLSLGIAIIGTPAVLLCDEPSSGMDPQARRNLWDVIAASTADMAVIITTHAMDEAEALCGRIGIMSRGCLRCVGSAGALKARYGDGHVVDAKARPGQADALEAHLLAGLPGAAVTERHADKLRLAVPRSAGVPLSRVFAVLEGAPAEDWAVGQSSLEAVFCAVAGAADAPAAQQDDA